MREKESKCPHCSGAGFKFRVGEGQYVCPFCKGKRDISAMEAFVYFWHEALTTRKR
jgi:hypothetical protein|nr:MAG TPA: DNA-directed RNA polymerase [Caudoviricetes sp.]